MTKKVCFPPLHKWGKWVERDITSKVPDSIGHSGHLEMFKKMSYKVKERSCVRCKKVQIEFVESLE